MCEWFNSELTGLIDNLLWHVVRVVAHMDLPFTESPPPPYVSPASSEKQLSESFAAGGQSHVISICIFDITFLTIVFAL